MLDIVSRVSVLSNDKFKGVKLKSEGNLLKIFSSNNDQESAEEELQLEVANEGFEIAFNVNYLREMLNTIEDKSISIQSFGNEKSALMKTTNDKRVLVLMPVRL